MTRIKTVTETDFNEEVLEAPTPVLVDVATRWCAPCRAVTPLLEQLANELGDGLKVVAVDADDSPQLSARLGVRGFPTVIAFDSGREVGRQLGVAPLKKFRALVRT